MTALAKTEWAVYNQSDSIFRGKPPVNAAVSKSEEPALLSTKLKMPHPRHDYIVRRALFEKLKRCSEMSVVFVKGAAGMGKTTLLSSFLMETGLKNTAWLSLDESNNSLFSFWRYFAAAAGTLVGKKLDFGPMPGPIYELREPKSSLVFLINRLCGETDYYIVLDDFHCITDPALISSLEFFLQSMPENLHLFLLSREDPPVYLGALAVSGKLLYLSGEDMKLSQPESMEFLRKTMKLKTDDTALEKISNFAEGWVGGLQLAAAGGEFSGDLLKRGGGFAAEYLTREIFGKLTPEEQNFLVRTGILPWFDADICSALFEALDYASMLENLLNKNLFLICIDEEKGVYRYHNILGEYLRQRFAELPGSEQNDILRQAAAAFEAQGALDEAVPLLLHTKDYDRVMVDLSQMGTDLVVGEYLSQIPNECLAKDLDLATRTLMYHADCGNFLAFSTLCNFMLKEWDGSPYCDYLRFAQDMFGSHHAANTLPPDAPLFLINEYHLQPETAALIFLGCSSLMIMNREYQKAERYADEATTLPSVSSSIYYYSMGSKAQLAEETGRLNDALKLYGTVEKKMAVDEAAFMQQYDFHIGIVGIYLKRMELPSAKKELDLAQTMICGNSIPANLVSYSYDYNLAEYYMLNGNEDRGEEIIRQITEKSETKSWADRLFITLQASGRLNTTQKEKILSEYESFLANSVKPSLAFELLCARIYLQDGETERAEKITKSVIAFSRENENSLRLVEADLLLLRMVDTSTPAGRRQQNNLLREAVYYAWENRILQPFYVDRDTVNPLWSSFTAALSDKMSEPERIFVRDAMRVCSGNAPGEEKGLLSSRETEVLAELAQGKTNPQIAEDLCISLSTVKTHLLSIYGKLGVSSRLNAASEGKRLGLIP